MRFVLDTHLLVSAFAFPGGPAEDLLRLALEERIELVTSVPILTEFSRVLSEKLGWEQAPVVEAVQTVARSGRVVRPTREIRVVRDDPADDQVLDAAVVGGAKVIVADDRHLLRLGSWGGIDVEGAATFLAGFKEETVADMLADVRSRD